MKYAARVYVMAMMLALTGCASTNPKDPFENFNRAMFEFNDTVDQAALKPAAEAYSNLPSFIQTGVSNFFGNLGDVWTAVNNMLQGKVADGMSDVMRVAVNSTLGLGGLLDIGSEAGLIKHKEDFGQTLGTWGVKPGPYLVLPLLGSSTVRDSLAMPLDFNGDPWNYTTPVRWRNTGSVVRVVDQRSALLGASTLVEEAALDRYAFIRDAYMQRRESTVKDGESPKASYDEDEEEEMARKAPPEPQSMQHEPAVDGPTPSPVEPATKPLVELELRSVPGSAAIIASAQNK
jgi:phospholipid-binding lipoprotein MlaA